jgi:hypothetical protein
LTIKALLGGTITEQPAQGHKGRSLIVMADNARIHLAKVVGCWLAENP